MPAAVEKGADVLRAPNALGSGRDCAWHGLPHRLSCIGGTHGVPIAERPSSQEPAGAKEYTQGGVPKMFSKTHTIEAILDLNPTAKPAFLAEFPPNDLTAYLFRLVDISRASQDVGQSAFAMSDESPHRLPA